MQYLRFIACILFILLPTDTYAKKETIYLVFATEMQEITDNYGYYPQLATLLKQQRKLSNNTYFFFGGDSLGPSVLSSLDRGSHIIDLLNSLEPDAMGVSKREFTFNSTNLSLRAYDATFPIISTNIVEKSTKEILDNVIKSTISYQGSTKLGFLSVVDKAVIEAYTINQISLLSLKPAVTEAAKELRDQNVDAIILHYSGYHPEINSMLDANIIDLSIHKNVNYQFELHTGKQYHKRDIFIKKAKDVALIEITVDSQPQKSVTNLSWQLIDISLFPKDADIELQTQNDINRLNTLLNIEIGTVGTPLNTLRTSIRTSENSFGNYIADNIRSFSKADLSLINSGLIRGDRIYNKGQQLTRGSIISELPYRNHVVIIELTGLKIIQALEHSFSLVSAQKGRFPQISGFKVTYDSAEIAGTRVKSILINGKPIVHQKVYRVATTDYLASGGDGYTILKTAPQIEDKYIATRLISDIVMDSIIKDKTIYPMTDGRITDINKSNL